MQVITLVLCLHVLAGVFWAGSTMAFALVPMRSPFVFTAQLLAGLVVVACGAYLWHMLHPGVWTLQEQLLSVGAVCAMTALTLQVLFVGLPLARSKRGHGKTTDTARIDGTNRLAALLLGIAATAMAAAKFGW